MLRVWFSPAFEENSEVMLLKTDSSQMIQILLNNNSRIDKSEDTFWFKKIHVTNHEYSKLDSTLVKMCKQKILRKNHVVLDGMGISSLYIYKKDTISIHFHSPSKIEDSIGYSFSKSLFEILKNTFQDTVVTDYFNDIESYIDESKWRRADPKRKFDQLRMKKYNWTIQIAK